MIMPTSSQPTRLTSLKTPPQLSPSTPLITTSQVAALQVKQWPRLTATGKPLVFPMAIALLPKLPQPPRAAAIAATTLPNIRVAVVAVTTIGSVAVPVVVAAPPPRRARLNPAWLLRLTLVAPTWEGHKAKVLLPLVFFPALVSNHRPSRPARVQSKLQMARRSRAENRARNSVAVAAVAGIPGTVAALASPQVLSVASRRPRLLQL